MNLSKITTITVLVFCNLSCFSREKKVSSSHFVHKIKRTTSISSSDLDQNYHLARRYMRSKNIPKALESFEKVIFSKPIIKSKQDQEKIFWSIDLSTKIYLKDQKNPDAAIRLLNKIDKKFEFNDAHYDIIQEWISVAKQWKKMGKLPHNIQSEKDLFQLGKNFYQSGMKKNQFSNDKTGKVDLYIAATYLVPIVYNFNNSKNIGEVLLMLGTIQNASWNDQGYWTENYYLKEVIHRFPHSELARKAYKHLEAGVRFAHTGSGGDFTTPSLVKMLAVYKRLSEPTKPKKLLFH